MAAGKYIRCITRTLGLILICMTTCAHALDLYSPPQPLQWKSEPHSAQSDTVTMEATPPESTGEVEYRFVCTAGDGPSSDWQAGPLYTANGLKPETAYTFVAHARSGDKPVGLPSSAVTVRTHPATGKGNVALIDEAIREGTLEYVPIMINGDKDNRINISLANRWEAKHGNAYNKPEKREQFMEHCRHFLKAFDATDPLAQHPYPEYKNFINFYALWWPDVPSMTRKEGEVCMTRAEYKQIRDRFFLPWQRPEHGYITQLAMYNSRGGGGNATRKPDLRIGDAMIVGNEVRGIIHEFSHTAPGIGDEYTSSGMWGKGGEGYNTTNDYRRDFCRWRAWIDDDTPVPTPYSAKYLDTIGLFEGATHRMIHLYRSTARTCLMGAGSGGGGKVRVLCAICRQRTVMRFYEYVDAIDERSPALNEITIPHPCRMKFSIRRVHPDPDTQKTTWRLNGKVIATNTDSVEVAFTALDRYELEFSLVDESPYIRPDPPFAEYPRASTTWTILNPKAEGSSEQMSVSVSSVKPVFLGVDNGTVTVSAEGGKAPYSFRWADGTKGPRRENLSPRLHTVTIVDSEYRSATREIDLTPADRIDPRLVSTPEGKAWRIECPAAEKEEVRVMWGSKQTASAISIRGDGDVTCELQHRNGCTTTRRLGLERPAVELEATVAHAAASSGGENNGSVQLNVKGGREPIRFLWSDGVETDQPERRHLHPGEYTVTVRDTNGTEQTCRFAIRSEPAFHISGLTFERQGDNHVRITNPDDDLEYLWYDRDIAGWLPRFPAGIYSGAYTSADGQVCDVDAYVIQNKAGYYVTPPDNQRPHHRNDPGFWTRVLIYRDGRTKEPTSFEMDLQPSDTGFALSGQVKSTEEPWEGSLRDGRMQCASKAPTGGSFDLRYVSREEKPAEPVATGTSRQIPNPGTYFIAARRKKSGAMSFNRQGVTFGRTPANATAPLTPDAVKSAKLMAWLDASDINANGTPDAPSDFPLRRGAVMKWQGKAGEVNFGGFVFYLPNALNGQAVASWQTIWVQGLQNQPTGYQTLIMLRREHDLSTVGTAPWSLLNPLIGVGKYDEALFSPEAAKALENARVFVDGELVTPSTARMPTDFYVATYEFDKPIGHAFGASAGGWEGSVAECLVFDGKLTDADRRGVEEYLRRKWLSAIDLEFGAPAGE